MTRYAIMVDGELQEVVEGRVQLGMRLASWGGVVVQFQRISGGWRVNLIGAGPRQWTHGDFTTSTRAWEAVANDALDGTGRWFNEPTLTVETIETLWGKLEDPDLAPEAADRLRHALAALEREP